MFWLWIYYKCDSKFNVKFWRRQKEQGDPHGHIKDIKNQVARRIQQVENAESYSEGIEIAGWAQKI